MHIDLEKILQDQEIVLSGRLAHGKMAPAYRRIPHIIPQHAIPSAVCILFHKLNGEYYFPLVIRSSHNDNDKHKGQIGLPGGRLEKTDTSLFHCAKRETEEEIGIQQSKIQFIKTLSPLYIDVSNFSVTPFLSRSLTIHEYMLEENEIADIVEFPVRALFDAEIKKSMDMEIRGSVYKDIPYFDFNGHIIWGATAMILSELEELISNYI